MEDFPDDILADDFHHECPSPDDDIFFEDPPLPLPCADSDPSYAQLQDISRPRPNVLLLSDFSRYKNIFYLVLSMCGVELALPQSYSYLRCFIV